MRRPYLRSSRAAALLGVLLVCAPIARAAERPFRRGDTNGDGGLDISDGIATLGYLFLGSRTPGCFDAADSDDSGAVDLTDGIYSFNYLFTGGPPPPAPGPFECGPDPTADDLGCEVSEPCPKPGPTDSALAGHVLNRVAYGPTTADLERIDSIGLTAWIEEQLDPASIDESGNDALRSREEPFFEEVAPSREDVIVAAGALWEYWRGSSPPPAGWSGDAALDTTAWPRGESGLGYGDGDDATLLPDMRKRSDDPATPEDESRPGYASLYVRRTFRLDAADLAAIDDLVLRVDFDDGFAAYLNGTRVAASGVPSGATSTTLASALHEAGAAEEFDLTARKGLLREGTNLLAIEGHNRSLTSSDFSLRPELIDRERLPLPPRRVIRSPVDVQRLVHVRGVYSRRQLQEVLAEFWENHFTTDFDKVAETLDALQNSDASDAMTEAQARREAAQLEYEEYEFFRQHALGNFGDLLLFSATSPTMLIYLDNILNVRGSANENYAREIFELHAFGVDNRYQQRDIEELARCFTGWTICKVAPGDRKPFPDSALDPPTDCGVRFNDRVLLGLGAGWRYFKGTREPSPGPGGEATADWAAVGFDDSAWLAGSTGLGYGDGDDATVLSDMRGRYVSAYLRRRFDVADPSSLENFLLAVDYDDGYVAYLNGVEVARSETMQKRGTPPPFDRTSNGGHEVDEGTDLVNLERYRSLLAPTGNVLAIQVHNTNLNSSDLSMLPRLLDRTILPGSVENGDPSGEWTFRFDPSSHDTGAKTLFAGTPYQIDIPGGRSGIGGLRDALDVVRGMVRHPSTAEFVSIKLIQRFVSDEISLARWRDGSVPLELRELLADMIAAWNSTDPPGDFARVMRTLLDPVERTGPFWSELALRSKVKTPIEFINSSLRALDASASGETLPSRNDAMGMHLFNRDDPDGWSELGFDWIDTAAMLERIDFAQALAENREAELGWDPLGFLQARGLSSAEEIVDHLDEALFQSSLPAASRELLLEFLQSDASGNPRPLDPSRRSEYRARIEEFLGLVLSLPQWQFQ